MSAPPELIPFTGVWEVYEELIYQAFLDSFVRREVEFNGLKVSAPYRPESRGKHFSFWHVISEAPNKDNRNEDDRIPDLARCARICWISWAIDHADNKEILWWENRRGNSAHVVIWARNHDFAVVLAKRSNYYVLKTAYAEIKPHRRKTFEREHQAFWGN